MAYREDWKKPRFDFHPTTRINPEKDDFRPMFRRENDESSRLERIGKEHDATLRAVEDIRNRYNQILDAQRRVLGETVYHQLALSGFVLFEEALRQARRDYQERSGVLRGLRESLIAPVEKINY